MSGTGGGVYLVDLAELDAVVTDLERCEAALDLMTQDLDRDMASLRSVWEGLSAEAQREAHLEW